MKSCFFEDVELPVRLQAFQMILGVKGLLGLGLIMRFHLAGRVGYEVVVEDTMYFAGVITFS